MGKQKTKLVLPSSVFESTIVLKKYFRIKAFKDSKWINYFVWFGDFEGLTGLNLKHLSSVSFPPERPKRF